MLCVNTTSLSYLHSINAAGLETRKIMQAELIATNIVTSYIYYVQIVDIDSSTHDGRHVPRIDYGLHRVRIILRHRTKSIWKLLPLLYR